ncbi:hypothetical protein Q8A73_003905 [Channa argus]|nr:hypothetical protein Q8A73_003905 [Channa argus]
MKWKIEPPKEGHDEESTNSSQEEDKSIEEEEEEGPTVTQATKQCERGKVKSKEKSGKTPTAAEFDESIDQTTTEEENPSGTGQKNRCSLTTILHHIMLEHPQERGIYYQGTTRMNRVCDCQEEKDLKKQERRSMDHGVNQDNVIIVQWCDSKAVDLVSSFVSRTPQGQVKL